jgi:PAS domain S-box-containing protein
MPQPISVLLVEDSPGDAELLLRQLRRAGFDPTWTRVDNEEDLRAALQPGLEVVLSDYKMPQLTGLRALDVLNASGLEVPFILISGTIGEDLAVSAMRAGAADYLMKDRLGRLGTAVAHALAERKLRRERRRAEELLRETVESMTAAQEIGNFGSWEVGLTAQGEWEGGAIRWSAQCFRIFGFEPGEFDVTFDRLLEAVHAEDRAAFRSALQATAHDGRLLLIEHRLMLRSGEVRHVRQAGRLTVDEATHRPVKLTGTVHDITDQRWANAAFRAQAAFTHDVLNSLSDHVVVLNEHGLIVATNAAWRRFARENGARSEDFIGLDYLAVCRDPVKALNGQGAAQAAAGIRAVLSGGQSVFSLEYPCDAPWEARWFRMAVLPLSVGRRGVVVSHQDITERKGAERELQWKTALLEAQVTASIDGILIVNPEGRKVLQNDRLAALFKIPPEVASDPDDRRQREWVAQMVRHPEIFTERIGHLLAHPEEVARDEIELTDGTLLDRYSAPVVGKTGTYYGRIWTFRDITERTRAERVIRESEERFRGLIENATDHIAVVDAAGCIDYQSPSAQRLLGYAPDEVVGQQITDFIHPDDRGIARGGMVRALANEPAKTVEYRIRHRDGRWRVFQSIGRLMPEHGGRKLIVVNSRDVTETRQLESQFLRAQRLEAIGTLSSGIAHDLNNILAPVLMATGLLRSDMNDPRSRELIAMIETGAQRGASIIRQLLTFSRGIEGERVSVQWRHLIKEMAEIARETFPRNITISERVPRDLRPVSADATQLHQVLMNLCVNARDAMPEGGELCLRAENVELTVGALPAHPEAKPGAYVLMAVKDSGTGIPPSVIDKIFDPFFTTKEIGKGTGLGLSTVLGIVKSHGGFITVESVPSCGTTFLVYLPVEATAGADAGPEPEPLPTRGQRELILLVDDEAAIRHTTTAALEQGNYRVVSAANGGAALSLFHQHRTTVKLILTDLMMPVMGGEALIQAVRTLEPRVRIIATTGLEPGTKRAELRALGANAVLIKPYTPQALLDAVREALTLP